VSSPTVADPELREQVGVCRNYQRLPALFETLLRRDPPIALDGLTFERRNMMKELAGKHPKRVQRLSETT